MKIEQDRMQAIREWHANGGTSLGHELVGELLGHVAALEAEKAPKPKRKPRRSTFEEMPGE